MIVLRTLLSSCWRLSADVAVPALKRGSLSGRRDHNIHCCASSATGQCANNLVAGNRCHGTGAASHRDGDATTRSTAVVQIHTVHTQIGPTGSTAATGKDAFDNQRRGGCFAGSVGINVTRQVPGIDQSPVGCLCKTWKKQNMSGQQVQTQACCMHATVVHLRTLSVFNVPASHRVYGLPPAGSAGWTEG